MLSFYKYSLTTLLILPLCFSEVGGQTHYENVRFSQIDEKDGLPRNTVYDITQDNHGFIWYCTPDGLCKYDGYSISRFTHNVNDSSTIAHNSTDFVINDALHDRLWVSTNYGICSYDNGAQVFHRYLLDGKASNSSKFAISKEGDVYASGGEGIFRFDFEKDCFEKVVNRVGGGVINFDDTGRLWLLSGLTLFVYDPKSGNKLYMPESLSGFDGKVRFFSILKGFQLIFSTNKGLFLYNIREDILRIINGTSNAGAYRCAEIDHNGNIWIGSESGIYVYDNNCNQIAHYEQSQSDVSMLNDSPVYSIFKDNEDNIWVGTYFGGVNYYIYGTDQFAFYSYGYADNHLSGKAVRDITNDGKGGLFIATEDGGLNYLSHDDKISRSSIMNPKFKINTKNVHYVYIDKEGKYWFGLFEQGVQSYDPATGRVQKYKTDKGVNSSGFCIAEDGRERIFYASPSGIYLIDKNNPVAQAKKISSRITFFLLNYNDSTMWVASKFNGVLELNLNTLKVKELKLLPNNAVRVTYLFRDSRGNVWISTNNDGLFIVDKDMKLIGSYSEETLKSSGIRGIVEDDNGAVWVATTNGLCCFNNNGSIRRFTYADGLPVNQFNFASACKRPDGKLFFGSIMGMIAFYPDDIANSQQHFNVSLTGFWSNNVKMSSTSLKKDVSDRAFALQSVTLTHKQARSITIEYSGLNYKYAAKIIYAMKMDGVDKDWQIVGNQHQVRFSDLRSGKYVLRIKGSPDGIDWDEGGQFNMGIKVLPPWWMSWWAFLLYAMIVGAVIFGSVRYTKSKLYLKVQLNEEKVRRQNVENLNRHENDFFTYVSHDLKTPLTMIISPLQRLVKQKVISNADRPMLKTIYQNANRMNFLIDELLSFSKIEMKREKINVRKGDIIKFLREISGNFQVIADEKEIEFVTVLDEAKMQVWFSPSKLERIIYNLLSNAFKYTSAGGLVKLKANYRIENGETFIDIIVSDTGRGIPKEDLDRIFEKYYQSDQKDGNRGYGLGLALTKSLVEIHNGSIRVESEVGKGSMFFVSLNVTEDAYLPEQRLSDDISSNEIEAFNQRMKDNLALSQPSMNHKPKVSKENILIVEDNRELNEYIANIFHSKFNTIQTYDGFEACEKIKDAIPDIIITDIMMPRMDGLELTKKVKHDIRTSHIPVIMLTAKIDEKDKTEGYLTGADAYITKPFNADNLELLVNNIISNRNNIIEHFKLADEIDAEKLSNNPRDEKFMKKLFELITKNMNNENFCVEDVLEDMGVSRSTLHAKIKALTGYSFTQLVRSAKMKEAKKRLASGMNVSETSFSVGISDPNYFTKCFRKEFGITPSEFLKKISQK